MTSSAACASCRNSTRPCSGCWPDPARCVWSCVAALPRESVSPSRSLLKLRSELGGACPQQALAALPAMRISEARGLSCHPTTPSVEAVKLGGTRQMMDSAGLSGCAWSLKGSDPDSSWYAITPAAQTSLAGTTSQLSTSGAMYLSAQTPLPSATQRREPSRTHTFPIQYRYTSVERCHAACSAGPTFLSKPPASSALAQSSAASCHGSAPRKVSIQPFTRHVTRGDAVRARLLTRACPQVRDPSAAACQGRRTPPARSLRQQLGAGSVRHGRDCPACLVGCTSDTPTSAEAACLGASSTVHLVERCRVLLGSGRGRSATPSFATKTSHDRSLRAS